MKKVNSKIVVRAVILIGIACAVIYLIQPLFRPKTFLQAYQKKDIERQIYYAIQEDLFSLVDFEKTVIKYSSWDSIGFVKSDGVYQYSYFTDALDPKQAYGSIKTEINEDKLEIAFLKKNIQISLIGSGYSYYSDLTYEMEPLEDDDYPFYILMEINNGGQLSDIQGKLNDEDVIPDLMNQYKDFTETVMGEIYQKCISTGTDIS